MSLWMRYRMLLLWLVVVLIAREALTFHRFNARDPDDVRLIFAVGVIIGLSVLIMFCETGRWTLRKAGIFGMILFDALFYGIFLSGPPLWGVRLSPGDQNWFRAILIASAPLLLISQIRHLVAITRARLIRRALARKESA